MSWLCFKQKQRTTDYHNTAQSNQGKLKVSDTDPNAPGEDYVAKAKRLELEQLAAEQGVQPITDIDSLKADFWPEDETIEDFVRMSGNIAELGILSFSARKYRDSAITQPSVAASQQLLRRSEFSLCYV